MDALPYRAARIALAVVIEHLPYGCDLAHDCFALMSKLRDQETLDSAEPTPMS